MDIVADKEFSVIYCYYDCRYRVTACNSTRLSVTFLLSCLHIYILLISSCSALVYLSFLFFSYFADTASISLIFSSPLIFSLTTFAFSHFLFLHLPVRI